MHIEVLRGVLIVEPRGVPGGPGGFRVPGESRDPGGVPGPRGAGAPEIFLIYIEGRGVRLTGLTVNFFLDIS